VDGKNLVFLHLSDIHFQRGSGGRYDIDNDLRNELLLDVGHRPNELADVQGVLVSGDIAFSGAPAEYAHAKDFLRELTDRIGIEATLVWCVPGNHDVNQSCVTANPLLSSIHFTWRNAELAALDSTIQTYMEHPLSSQMLLEPITEYNKFAAAYASSMSANKPTWRRDFFLNDGSCLRLNGLNSTIISDDSDDEGGLVLGQFQVPRREVGVTHVIMCHHPPDRWLDAASVEDGLNARAHVQLFGHKHLPRFDKINNTLRISAGAVHPDRRVPRWRPCFNWLSMCAADTGNHRELCVDIYPHVWDDTDRKFIADTNSCHGRTCRQFHLELESMRCDTKSLVSVTDSIQIDDATGVANPQPTEDTGNVAMDRERTLTYQFFLLPHVVRLQIATSLGLVKDEDEGLPDYELFGRVLKRAADAHILDQLWDEVEKKHGRKGGPNPFRDK
jgi:hypothetical protein